jgi:c-di-GMP-binding flagellar brake protein YcgR
MIIEKRKFIRFDIPLSVEFKLSEEAAEYFLGVTRNFSREGLGIVSQNFNLKPKDTIRLRLNLPDKDTFVSVLGNIIWKKRFKAKCLAGVRLREMDKEAKSEILDYAYNLWVERIRTDRIMDNMI